MSFTRSLPRLNAKGSSKPREDETEAQQLAPFAADRLEFDLVAQLTHMSALATAGYDRDRLFDMTARLPYTTSGYFRQVRLLTSKLGYDYPQACEVVAERTENEAMRSFLLRFAGSLASGERELEFLARETEVQFEGHRNTYERDLESLRKWTDGFVALEVSVALIVIISVVSMMIFPMGSVFILGLCAIGMLVSGLGAYLIYRSAPQELMIHTMRWRSPMQDRTLRLARFLLPAGVIAAGATYFVTSRMEVALIIAGAALFPVGFFANKYHGEVDRRDRDSAPFLRALGGIAAAIGTTPTEALGRIDLRSIGTLQHEVARLGIRLRNGITPDLCWRRFVGETGSELIRRSIAIFWDGIAAGGDAGRIGYFASRHAMHIHLLRAKRALVSSTFGWLMIPMHGTLVALLSFITEIFTIFSAEIVKAQSAGLTQETGLDAASAAQIPTNDMLAFGALDMVFVRGLILTVILGLTVVNGFVTNAAHGGDRYRFCYPLSMMALISGITLLIVPFAADLIFGGLTTIE